MVLLQHPREARLAICSAWLTRLALANAELHRGFSFERDAHVMGLAARERAALLYPGPEAAPIARLSCDPPPILFVLDGTWTQTEKMLGANPRLASLRRVSFGSTAPSGYRDLRREPAPHCLSTLEAVATALSDLEGGTERFAAMRAAFARMVELQLACSQDGRRSPRHRRERAARARDGSS